MAGRVKVYCGANLMDCSYSLNDGPVGLVAKRGATSAKKARAWFRTLVLLHLFSGTQVAMSAIEAELTRGAP
jgi:hypothetical protein